MGKKSKRAKKKSAPVKNADEKNGILSAIVQHPIISLLVILATFIGLYFAIFPRSDVQLNSKIDKIGNEAESLTNALGNQAVPECSLAVYPYANPVPKQPFETDFVLENKGLFEIRDVTCDFKIRKIVLSNGGEIMNGGLGGGVFFKELHAGQQATLHSSNVHGPIISDSLKYYAEMEILVSYSDERTPQKKQSRSIVFFTKLQENGEMIWYPMGQ